MQNKEQDNAPQAEESQSKKHDADSGNDGSSNQMLQKENLIDPGNEHHHHDQENETSEKNTGDSSKHDADAGSDGTGTAGPEPGEGENDKPDVTGEDG